MDGGQDAAASNRRADSSPKRDVSTLSASCGSLGDQGSGDRGSSGGGGGGGGRGSALLASPGTVDPSEPIARGDEEEMAVVASHTAEELLSEAETVTESAFSSEGDDSGFGEEDHPAVSPAHIREENALARSASLDSLVPAEADDASVEVRRQSTQARMDEIVERESLTYPPELRGLFSPSSPSSPSSSPLLQPPSSESTPPVVSPVVREEAQPYKPTRTERSEQSERSERSERSARVRPPRRIADNNRLEKELRAMHVLVGSLLESIGGGGGGGDDGGGGDGGGDDGGDSGCAGDNGGSGGGGDGLSDRDSPQRGSPPRGSSDYSLERPRKWVDAEDDDSPLPSPLPSYMAAANTEGCSTAAAASPMRPLEMGGGARVSRYGGSSRGSTSAGFGGGGRWEDHGDGSGGERKGEAEGEGDMTETKEGRGDGDGGDGRNNEGAHYATSGVENNGELSRLDTTRDTTDNDVIQRPQLPASVVGTTAVLVLDEDRSFGGESDSDDDEIARWRETLRRRDEAQVDDGMPDMMVRINTPYAN